MADTETGAPPRVVLVVAAVLVVALAAVVAVFALTKNQAPPDESVANGPLPLVAVPAPQAGTPACTAVVGAMPATLTSNGRQLARRTLAQPAPQATVAWGDGDAIVLRCGLDRPPELTQTAELRLINGVQWLQVTEDEAATWYVVDRDVYLALTVPDSAGTGPLQTVSDTVAAKLPDKPLKF
ncbi:DUF3515 domain-containing protein [Amycolatopsis sp. FDAARGOS 1241]|uniref:DUF3515 domain-containing protein n=1 Tax=Amycolatopsis sp. FDAARGOS 1241 TaxID=2778070 RepID=UPI00194EDC34|nr:DUF3515 domain-containing protein [Amycolatopsis sp. FDAARGOS 1241]QRP44500.1 DUF3515 domain-containing protein [Amycolatopsis sp. FDAARGOS 1241]